MAGCSFPAGWFPRTPSFPLPCKGEAPAAGAHISQPWLPANAGIHGATSPAPRGSGEPRRRPGRSLHEQKSSVWRSFRKRGWAGLGGDDSPAAPGVAHMGQIYTKTTSKGRGHPSLRLGSLGWRTQEPPCCTSLPPTEARRFTQEQRQGAGREAEQRSGRLREELSADLPPGWGGRFATRRVSGNWPQLDCSCGREASAQHWRLVPAQAWLSTSSL